jgi:DNA-directed RNA polymerase subunit H (RpoH/RPB5)
MHIHQPRHTRLKQEEVKNILEKYNVSVVQLPKIKITDICVPEGSQVGDVLKIERKDGEQINIYFRVVAA